MAELNITKVPAKEVPAERMFYVHGMVGFAIQAESEAQAVERAQQLPVQVATYGLRATEMLEHRH